MGPTAQEIAGWLRLSGDRGLCLLQLLRDFRGELCGSCEMLVGEWDVHRRV